MKVNGRDWPPDDYLPSAPRKPPPESWLVIFLIPGAPLIAWILAMIVPASRWVLLVWPIGWLVAWIVTLVSVYTRERKTK